MIFSKGSIEFKGLKKKYTFGEEITGTVILNIKKKTDARCFYIQLFATKTKYSEDDADIIPLFEERKELDTKKIYPAGEILTNNFCMKIPSDLQKKKQGFLEKMVFGTINWYLEARLEGSGLIELKKTIRIDVG